jgi:outer membrane protein assembly factor BamB
MTRCLFGAVLILAASAGLEAQQYNVVTRATPPPREALERLSLVNVWHARVPVHGQRDGIFSLQVIPGPRTQLIVQTQGGLVALLDGESGDVLWRTQVGIPGWISQAAGANANSIFVTRRHELHVLNRQSGYERVYTVERDTKQVNYGMAILGQPSAEPVADGDHVYISTANRLVAYALPLFEIVPKKAQPAEAGKENDAAAPPEAVKAAPAKPEPVKAPPAGVVPGRPFESSLQPAFAWSYTVGDESIQQPPILGDNQVAAVTTAGGITSLNRFEGKYRLDYRIAGTISRSAGQHGSIAYLGSDDTYVYALNLGNGELLWRHLAGAPLAHRPAVNDRDVFVSPALGGLTRIDRATGRELWRNRQVERFLAANPRFVYSTDPRGRLHILDGLRGTALAQYDLQDWKITVANELTDRIYLASRDGQIICLRHRDHPSPLQLKSEQRRKVVPKDDVPAEEKKVEEEKKEEKGAARRCLPCERSMLARMEASRRLVRRAADRIDARRRTDELTS